MPVLRQFLIQPQEFEVTSHTPVNINLVIRTSVHYFLLFLSGSLLNRLLACHPVSFRSVSCYLFLVRLAPGMCTCLTHGFFLFGFLLWFLFFLSGSLLVRVPAWHTVSFFSGSCFLFFFSRRACFCWHVYLPQRGCQMDLSLSTFRSPSLSLLFFSPFCFLFLFFFLLLLRVGRYSVSSCLKVLEGESCEKYPDSPPLLRGNFCATGRD